MGLFTCAAHSAVSRTALAMLSVSRTSQAKNLAADPASSTVWCPSSFMSRMATLPPLCRISRAQALPSPEALGKPVSQHKYLMRFEAGSRTRRR